MYTQRQRHAQTHRQTYTYRYVNVADMLHSEMLYILCVSCHHAINPDNDANNDYVWYVSYDMCICFGPSQVSKFDPRTTFAA